MDYSLASSTWDENELQAMQEVISSGQFTMGAKVKAFEQSFADYFGARYAVMSNSGSSANLLAVAAMRYRKDFDPSRTDIIVPAVSWSTTYYPVHQLGFRLKFVDVDLDTLNASVEAIADAVDKKTAGIFAVNLLGNPSELEQLRELAKSRNVFLIEDNCESMGAKLNKKFTGTFGQIGTFSTFFSHHISTMEGGMCLTDDLELAQIMTSMRAHGWTRELPVVNHVHNKSGRQFDDLFRFVLPGYNLRPLELEAAIGISQLEKLPRLIEKRRENADKFRDMISNRFPQFIFQKETGESSWFGFTLIAKEGFSRQIFLESLDSYLVQNRPIVAGNFTKNPVIRHLNHAPIGAMPNAEKIDKSGFFVGNHHFDMDREFKILNAALISAIGNMSV